MIISILAASVLYIMTNDARITESNIKRIQANYAAQAGMQYFLDCSAHFSLCSGLITVDGITVNIASYGAPFPVGSGCPNEGLPTPPSANCIAATADY